MLSMAHEGPWGASEESGGGPWKRTTSPATTVGSMIAVKFAGGVAVLADRNASYGKWQRYKNIPRLIPVPQSDFVTEYV